uniref:Uncharacterized protein n=1 Tax=Zea mays TaxID=4577 RepID=C4J4L7_MAIZE|nr:unknown [Zea mays]
MTTVNSSFSVRSTSSPSAWRQSNSLTRLATKYSRCSSASAMPGQTRRPAPNGIILISLLPVRSTSSPSPPGRNRSGRNSAGALHTSSSIPMSPTAKLTGAPAGTRYPSSVVSSCTACGST